MELKKPSLAVRAKRWWRMQERRTQIIFIAASVFAVVVGLVLIGLAIAGGTAPPPTPTPTATLPPTAPPTAIPPTNTPIPPTPEPEPTEIPPTPIPTDPQGDVTGYDGGPPIEDAPAGVDIRMASVHPDMGLMLQDATGAPSELQAIAAEGDALFWITLHQPIPNPPEQYTEWLFALDLDGDTATGRPVDSARINPDIGMEVAIAVYYDDANEIYGTYYLIWNPAQGGFSSQAADISFVVSESRFAVGFALPLSTLTQNVADVSGVTVAPEAARGRAAVLAGTGAQRVIDFYPDRPE